jgi:hypothetical protein
VPDQTKLIALICLVCRWLRQNKLHAGHDDCAFPGMLEIDGCAAGGHGLNLAQTPLGLIGVADKTSRNETLGHGESWAKVGEVHFV